MQKAILFPDCLGMMHHDKKSSNKSQPVQPFEMTNPLVNFLIHYMEKQLEIEHDH